MSDERDIEDLVLEGSEYELLRIRHGTTSIVSVRRKIRWCGGLLVGGSGLYPIVLLVPEPVTEAYMEGTATGYPLGLAMILLLAAGPVAVGGLGLWGIVYRRSQIETLTEEQAWTLVGLEDVFSGIGLVTGGIGVIAVLALASIGLGGVETVGRFQAVGIDPYYQGPYDWITAPLASAVSLGLGTAILAVGAVTDRLEGED